MNSGNTGKAVSWRNGCEIQKKVETNSGVKVMVVQWLTYRRNEPERGFESQSGEALYHRPNENAQGWELSAHPKRIEMKIRGPPITFWLTFRKCSLERWKISDLDGNWADTKNVERVTSSTFAIRNGWSAELWDYFCAIDRFLSSLEKKEIHAFRMKKSLEVSKKKFSPLSLSNRSPLFGAWSTTVLSVCGWLAGCPVFGAWNTSGGSSLWVQVPFFPLALSARVPKVWKSSSRVYCPEITPQVAWIANGGCFDLLRCLPYMCIWDLKTLTIRKLS